MRHFYHFFFSLADVLGFGFAFVGGGLDGLCPASTCFFFSVTIPVILRSAMIYFSPFGVWVGFGVGGGEEGTSPLVSFTFEGGGVDGT
jgi:hypothetical protein